MPTQSEYNVSKQTQRVVHMKINLLNFNYLVVDELSGVVVSLSTTIDANADIRRTCDVSLVVTDSSFNIEPGNKIWLDKYIQVYKGIESNLTGEIVWTNLGLYLINSPSYSYNATTNTLTFQGVDLMSKLTGMRNGYLEGLSHVIAAGSNIRSVMVSTLGLAGITKYVLQDNPQTVPNEIKIDVGGTVYDILSTLRDITPSWEIFFDVDGVFHYQPIPTGVNEMVSVDEDLLTANYISHKIDTDFETIKNSIEVFGKTHDVDYYCGTATVSGSKYSVTNAGVTALTDGLVLGFTAPSIVTNPTLQVNSLTTCAIENEDGTAAVIPKANEYYVVKYDATAAAFIFWGYLQAYGKVQDTNADSPFYINGTVGEIRLPLYGGDYEVIWTNDLAEQRAKYELYLHCQMQDSLQMVLVPISWLDVNTLVSFRIPNETVTKTWIIKSINTSHDASGTQTVNMVRYYPDYSYIS